jgi:hypothetical protein
MKKQFFFLLVFISATVFIFSSCNKKDSTPVVPKTKTELLVLGAWKFKGATSGGSDISGSLQACQKDNIMTFLAAGTGSVDEGPAKCNAADPQINPLTWNFASSETILHVSATLFSNTGNDFTLISLTETELVVSIIYAPPIGPTFLVVITFQH